MTHPVEGLRPGPLAGQDLSLLKSGDVLKVVCACTYLTRHGCGNGALVTVRGVEGHYIDLTDIAERNGSGAHRFHFVSTKPQGGDQGALQAQAPSVTTEQAEGAVVSGLADPFIARKSYYDLWYVERELSCINGLSAWFPICSVTEPTDEEVGYSDGACGSAQENANRIAAALNQAELVWSVHARGPDEIVAAKSYDDAVDYCDRLNLECTDVRAVPMLSPSRKGVA